MTLLAYGAKRVSALETTLGGKPPKKAADKALAALKQQMRERFERRNTQMAKMRPLMEKSRAPLLELIKKERKLPAAAALEKRRTPHSCPEQGKAASEARTPEDRPSDGQRLGFLAQGPSLRCAVQRREWQRLGIFQYQRRRVRLIDERRWRQRLSIGRRGGLVLGNRG